MWNVTKEESGLKLSEFLKNKLGDSISSRQIKKALENNHCQINRRTERFGSFTVGLGDTITLIEIPSEKTEKTTLNFVSERCLYEDENFLIYDKPNGVPSDSPILLASVKRNHPFLALTHRLDRDTTGALVFAKNPSALHYISELFKNRDVKKSYLAIVDGSPKQTQGIIENTIGPLKRYQGQTIHGEITPPKGLQALTHWHLEKSGKDCALLQCSPATGRTHQIRVHLSSIGHPILGDFQYGNRFKCLFKPNRYLLHAEKISFPCPSNGQLIHVQAPLPTDFNTAIHQLFRSSPR